VKVAVTDPPAGLAFGEAVDGSRRTALIVEPSDGRLPPLTPRGETLRQELSLWEDVPSELPIRTRSTGSGNDGPENRGLAERCLVGFNTGPPMLPSGYNNHMQIFQTDDQVAILNEMVHDTRIIPLDGRASLPDHVRHWAGSSRGRWEGDTLVVETGNFTDRTASFDPNPMFAIGSGEHLRLTERFQRVDADTLLYEFTIDDPATFTEPFTVAVSMRRSEEPVFEYACHEGNYGLLNILRGARVEEQTGEVAR